MVCKPVMLQLLINKGTKVNKRISILRINAILVSVILAVVLVSSNVSASHSWNNYHWARQSNPFTLKLSSNLSSNWAPYLATTSNDWSASSVLDTTVVAGTKNQKTCKPTLGQVEVCNSKYGNNGWLGLAQIWIDSSGHITQGTTKMNDTYFQQARYNTPEERNHVMCQEVGHTFGLGHQDESGASLGTCMDYSMDPASQHPNAHDYEELEAIYSHLDSKTTVGGTSTGSAAQDQSDLNNQQNFGRRVYKAKNGYFEVYEKQYHDGSKLISLVNLAH
jgi:hypothetical protein